MVIGEDLLPLIPPAKREALIGILKGDPRPSYHEDPERIYGFEYADLEIRFQVENEVLRVCEIIKKE